MEKHIKPLFTNASKTLQKDFKRLELCIGVVANKNRIYFVTSKDYKNYKIHLFQRDNSPKEQLKLLAKLKPLEKITSCEMSFEPKEEFIICGYGDIHYSFDGVQIVDETIKGKYGKNNLCRIGKKIYSPDTCRKIHIRNENGEFQRIGIDNAYKNAETFDRSLDEDGETDYISALIEDGFIAIDGFNENHFYAVGGKGDVWRYVDGVWTKCQFNHLSQYSEPINFEQVCCGEDGYVYISGTEGETFVGKENDWKIVKKPKTDIDDFSDNNLGLQFIFNSMVWYDGKVWASNEHCIAWITPDSMQIADIPYLDSDDIFLPKKGHLYANDGILLLMSGSRIAILENKQWIPLTS